MLRWRRDQERLDRRAALAAWAVLSVNIDHEKHPQGVSLEDVVDALGHGFQQRREPPPAVTVAQPPPTVEGLTETMGMLNTMFGGEDVRNGKRYS